MIRSSKNFWLSASLFCWVTLVSASADADSGELGQAGNLTVSVGRLMGVFSERRTQENDQGEVSRRATSVGVLSVKGTSISALPRLGIDYFVGPSLTVGGEFMFLASSHSEVSKVSNNNSEQDDDLGSSSAFVLHPRAGYALSFGGMWGFWPHAGLMFAQESSKDRGFIDDMGGASPIETTASSFNLMLDAMFYASPISHLYIACGPYFDAGIWGSHTVQSGAGQEREDDYTLTSFGVSFTLGGYF